MQLSEHFKKEEFERDGSSMPDDAVIQAYWALCSELLEPIRAAFPEPFLITSGYRSPEANQRIGGVIGSQHIATGNHCAADFYLESYRNSMQPVFNWVRNSQLPYDQLILEHGKHGDVIHISWSDKPRRQALEGATFNQTSYAARYSVPKTGENI